MADPQKVEIVLSRLAECVEKLEREQDMILGVSITITEGYRWSEWLRYAWDGEKFTGNKR